MQNRFSHIFPAPGGSPHQSLFLRYEVEKGLSESGLGLHLAEMGQKNDFLKKNALKTAFLGDTIMDRLTSEGAGTQILKKKIATFSMFLFKFGP